MPRIQDGSGGLAWAIGVRMPTIATSSRARNAEPRRLDRMANYLRPPRLQVNSSRRGPDPPSPCPLPHWGERDEEEVSPGARGMWRASPMGKRDVKSLSTGSEAVPFDSLAPGGGQGRVRGPCDDGNAWMNNLG